MLGVAGLVGSGRTELAETLFGLEPADGGEILLHGKPVRIESPSQAIRLGIGYVPEDRRQHGVVLEMPVAANATLASLGAVSSRGLIDRGRRAAVGRGLRHTPPHQDAVGHDRGRRALRRESAEGRAGPLAVDRARTF